MFDLEAEDGIGSENLCKIDDSAYGQLLAYTMIIKPRHHRGEIYQPHPMSPLALQILSQLKQKL